MLAALGAAPAPASAQEVRPAEGAPPRRDAEVRSALRRQQSVLGQCYAAARQDERGFAAMVSLALDLEEDGSVSGARIVGGRVPMGARSFEECIVLAARRFELPPGPRETQEHAFRFGRVSRWQRAWQPVRRPPVIRCGGGCMLDIRGALSREVIRRAFTYQRPAVRACYERELQRTPALSGRAVVQVVIRPDGAVARATVSQSSFAKPEPRLEACLERVASALLFPAIGETVVVTHPYVFKHSPDARSRPD